MQTSDVAIVGAGFAGCATAWALAGRGIRSIVLERESELGRHASGRGAGLGRTLAEDDATSALTIRGAAILRERFPDAWSPTGGLLTWDRAEDAEAYGARAAALDIPHERVDRNAVLRYWPRMTGLPIAAALYLPLDGVIENRRLLAALTRDVTIAYDCGVSRIEPAGRGVRLTTSEGPIEVRVVVDAAGAWAGEALGDPPLENLKRHLFTLEAPAPSAPYLWHLGKDELYLRGDAGAVLACPCDAEATRAMDQVASPGADALMAQRLAAAGWTPAIATRWACQRAFAPDRLMRIGRDPRRPWLVWAAALGGHGATAATAVGELAAEAIALALDH